MITPKNVFILISVVMLICTLSLIPSLIIAHNYGITGGVFVFIVWAIMMIISCAVNAIYMFWKTAKTKPYSLFRDVDGCANDGKGIYEIPQINTSPTSIFCTELSGTIPLQEPSERL